MKCGSKNGSWTVRGCFRVCGERGVLDGGGSQFVYDGEGASGYASYRGGGKEGGVPDHHVGGPL